MGQEAEERVEQEAEVSAAAMAQGETSQDSKAEPPSPPPKEKRPARISSPEQVDDYIRVTTPGMWLLVVALLVLLCAGVIWAYASRIEKQTIDENGQVTTEYVAPASFLTDGTAGR